jgi:hypothetical protein
MLYAFQYCTVAHSIDKVSSYFCSSADSDALPVKCGRPMSRYARLTDVLSSKHTRIWIEFCHLFSVIVKRDLIKNRMWTRQTDTKWCSIPIKAFIFSHTQIVLGLNRTALKYGDHFLEYMLLRWWLQVITTDGYSEIKEVISLWYVGLQEA